LSSGCRPSPRTVPAALVVMPRIGHAHATVDDASSGAEMPDQLRQKSAGGHQHARQRLMWRRLKPRRIPPAFTPAARTDCSFARSVSAPNEICCAQLVGRIESAESCYFSLGTPATAASLSAMATVVVVTMSLSTAAAVGDGRTFHRHCRPASDANGAVERRHQGRYR